MNLPVRLKLLISIVKIEPPQFALRPLGIFSPPNALKKAKGGHKYQNEGVSPVESLDTQYAFGAFFWPVLQCSCQSVIFFIPGRQRKTVILIPSVSK